MNAKQKKLIWKGVWFQLYDILKKAKLLRQIEKWLPAVRKGEMAKWSTEDVQSSENTFKDTIKVDECHCTLTQTHRLYNTQSEP